MSANSSAPPSPAATLVLGGASWNTMVHLDSFPPPRPATIASARSYTTAGSTGIGKAMALAALGHDALLHATVGADEAGQQLRAQCQQRGLTVWWDVDPAGTSRHLNLMDARGQRISIFLCNGSAQPPVDAARLAEPIARASTIFLNITPSSMPLLPLVARSRAEVWVDLHDYDGANPYHEPFIAQADVLQFSDEAVADPRALMQRLIAGARLVVCTRGERGALALDGAGQWHEQAASPAALVDSNGAGDTFLVALWHALQAREPLASALRFAATAAAMAVESPDLVPASMNVASIAARAGQSPGHARG